MLRKLAFPVAAGLALVLSACGEQDTHGKIMADTLNLLEELATTLEQATDNESAWSASEQVLRLTAEFKEIASRSDAVGKPSAEMKQALTSEHAKRRAGILSRIKTASERAKSLNNERLTDSLRKLGEAWSSLP